MRPMRCGRVGVVMLAALVILGGVGRLGAQSIRIVATQSLAFGTVAPRQSRSIAPGSGSAGQFVIQGPANASLLVTPSLPASLSGTAGLVPLSAWTATTAMGAGGSAVSVTPVSNSEFPVVLGADGMATVSLGASLIPTLGVRGGTYTGTIGLVARESATGRQSLTAQTAVSATLLQPITITAVPMFFPAVYAGTPVTIAPESARGLRLLFDGALTSAVDVTFDALPSVLTLSGGGAQLSIGNWTQRTGADCSGSPSTVFLGSTMTLNLSLNTGNGGRNGVCLGATVTPSPVQAAGVYSGSVTVSVRYTGA